ncbi:MAG: hypothetical protein H6824_06710 [Planctomycetaceae bacterium]|nr:hypothetical protein [Planctomycetaceae bacterium]
MRKRQPLTCRLALVQAYRDGRGHQRNKSRDKVLRVAAPEDFITIVTSGS